MERRYAIRLVRPPGFRKHTFERALAAAIVGGPLARFVPRVAPLAWQGAEARFSVASRLGEAADPLVAEALLGLEPEVIALDCGDGWQPLAAEPPDAGGLALAPTGEPRRVFPEPPEELRARYPFDDHVLLLPSGGHAVLRRDAQSRCHFESIAIVDGDGTRAAPLPQLHDYPKVAFSPDGARLAIGGPLDVLLVELGSARVERLARDEAAAGFDVCWLGDRRLAHLSAFRLTLHALDRGPEVVVPAAGGRLVRAVLGGRVLLVGVGDGTVALGVDGTRLRRLARDWRSLVDAWGDSQVWVVTAEGGVHEVVGLAEARARAFAEENEPELSTLLA